MQALADAGAAPVATLAKGKANLFLDGNPIVYGGAVDAVANGKRDAPPRTGDPIIVADHEGKALAWGVYNDTSQYVVRILRMAWECELAPHPASGSGKTVAVKCDVEEVIRDKIKVAARMRSDCGVALGNANGPTTVYRLVNSEGDGLSGVCVDVYDCGGKAAGGCRRGGVRGLGAHATRRRGQGAGRVRRDRPRVVEDGRAHAEAGGNLR